MTLGTDGGHGEVSHLLSRGPNSSEMPPHPAHNVLPKLFQSLITTFESLEQVQSTLHGGDPQLVSWPSYVHPIPIIHRPLSHAALKECMNE